ncbi:hypothetical protein [Maridesulfovibrio ferrireducens]|uniref:hypothetical protein n=1 Tax=Maridesulfovibrio ferrireducens TaxID=246191 RepID=UPI001A296C9A|nr:hypothetical protein [Maridesulfovibrio ferrireducens]MBI9112223.1 hypothetical protein [Maridesulfovibrio ferrireducens]
MKNQKDFIEAEDQKPVRKKIKGFNYEIDDQGRLYSTQYHSGYGFGWQMMPGKPGKSVRPQYTLTCNKESINFSVQELVSEHFIPAVEFDVAWYRKTREEAKENNTLLRAKWLRERRQANEIGTTAKASIEETKLVEEARKIANQQEKQDSVSKFAPWANKHELNSSCRIFEQACSTGFDFRDSNFYPFS